MYINEHGDVEEFKKDDCCYPCDDPCTKLNIARNCKKYRPWGISLTRRLLVTFPKKTK